MSQIMTKFRMFFFLAWYEIFLLPFDKDIVLMKYAWHLNYSIEVQSFAYHVMEIEVFFNKTWKKLDLWLLFSYKINTRRIKVFEEFVYENSNASSHRVWKVVVFPSNFVSYWSWESQREESFLVSWILSVKVERRTIKANSYLVGKREN